MNRPQDQLGADKLPKDDVASYPASAADMQLYVDAQMALARLQAPVFVHADNPHEYLYVACFDGTGYDKNKDSAYETNVGKISDQVFTRFQGGHEHIAQGYVPGPGTEDGWFRRVTDGADGYTYDTRLERMYDLFIRQARQWKQIDPAAQISVAETGFSRGAEEAAGFARLIEERGIQDPTDAIYTRNSHGQITHVQYTRPPLVPPHDVAQAVALFDPVGTGAPEAEYDRRLPPSVISGIQLIATEERRELFKSDHIIDPGATDHGRFLGLYVPGAHSDVGGSYRLDGLSLRADDLVVDYLNALSDTPFLHAQATPDKPALNVVHRSEEGSLLYRLWPKVNRLQPEGCHTLEIAEDQKRTFKGDAYNAEPINQALNARFEHQPVTAGRRAPLGQLMAGQTMGKNLLDDSIDRLYQGMLANDTPAVNQATQGYLQSARGQVWQQQVLDYTQAMQAQAVEQQQAVQQQVHAAPHHVR